MTRPQIIFAIAALTLLGFALRLHQINEPAIRGDETFTIRYWMGLPLAESLAVHGTADPHPPLAYASYRAWGLLVSQDDRIVRLLPALVNTIGIPLLYTLGRRLSGSAAVGLIAALLWAVHPFQIWHAQDARNYALWGPLSALGVWLAVRALEQRRPLDWALYITAACLAAYMYYLEVFVLFALSVYVGIVYWRDRVRLLHWLVAMVAVGLVLAPWYLRPEIRSGGGYGGTTGGFQPAQLWERFIPTLNFGATISPEWLSFSATPLLVLLLTGLVLFWRRHWQHALLTALLGTIPLLLLSLVSLRLNVFAPRYVLASAPAYTVIVALLVVLLLRGRWYRLLLMPLLGFYLYGIGLSLNNHYSVTDYTKSPNWNQIAGYINDYTKPDDIIIQRAADEGLNYAYEQADIQLDRKQLPANPRQSIDEITGLLAADAAIYRSIWLVAQTFPDWPNAGVVDTWVNDHMQQVRATTVSGLAVEQYMPWDVAPDELAPEPLANFDDVAELAGVQIIAPPELNDQITVWLYWQPLAQTERDLKVFVHLLGDINPATGTPLWSQADQFPQHGRVATTTWEHGTILRDVYTLPLTDVPSGVYDLSVGWYDPASGERLPVGDGDHVIVGQVRVP